MEDTKAEQDPMLGRLLQGRYRIRRMIGQGGMGCVYEAQHELIGRRLAIKCLHPEFLTNPVVVERFQREAQAATAVGNEHIIEVTDMGTLDDGSPFIVLEYLDGTVFSELLSRQGYLPIARLVHIIRQVCDALAAAHAKGIVHRDLKPENIFLIDHARDPDFVKVLDFGISKMRESSEQVQGSLTKTGTALGTPYFMAPEQAQGRRDVDHRADVYALGVILYQGLTGKLPFEADSYPMLMVKIMTQLPPPMAQHRPGIDERLERVVLKAMAKDREQRFQSVKALSDALQPFAPVQHSERPQASEGLPHGEAFPPSEPFSPPDPVASGAEPHEIREPGPATNAEHGATTPFAWSETVMPEPTPVPVRRGPTVVVLGAAGLLLAAGAAWVVHGMIGPSPPPRALPTAPGNATATSPQPPSSESSARAPSTAQSPSRAQTASAAPGKPAEVRVRITAAPSNAKILIDGVEFPNPMDAWRPRSLDPVRIRVEKPGYKTVEQVAIFDQDRALDFELQKGRGVTTIRPTKPGPPASHSASPSGPAQPGSARDRPEQAATTPASTEPPRPSPAERPVGNGRQRPQTPRPPQQPPGPEAPTPAPSDIYQGPTGTIRDEF